MHAHARTHTDTHTPGPQVAARLPKAEGVLVTAGGDGAAYCFRSAKGEHSGFVPVYKVGWEGER